MKGFIEVTLINRNVTYLISISSILRVINTKPVIVVTKELISNYSGSISQNFEIKETYEEIKQLIKESTEL